MVCVAAPKLRCPVPRRIARRTRTQEVVSWICPGSHYHFSARSRQNMYQRLTWKCEVGAQLGLKRLIWG